MKFNSIVTFIFLIIPFFITSRTTAEIFELVNYYDITVSDIESADFNNDGLEDFAVADWIIDSSYYEVFLSNGDCSFTRLGPVYIDTSYVFQLLTADFNEDSNKDVLLMSLEESWLYLGDGTGNFILNDVFPWSYLNGCIGDVDNDGHLDLVGVNSEGNTVTVMLGDGMGHFTLEWESVYYDLSSSCKLAYFNGPDDTDLDLYIACNKAGAGVLLFEGTGDGSFTDSTFYEITDGFGLDLNYHCTHGDLNENGYMDIAIAGTAGMSDPSTFIFLNQQDGTFEIPEYPQHCYFYGGCSIEKLASVDLDLDGHLDLSLGAEIGGSIAGYGDGMFNAGGSGWLSTVPGADFLDMDIDGDLDLVMKWGGIYRNTTINLGIEGHESGSVFDLNLQASPNPFSNSVTITASDIPGHPVDIQIFDLSGRMLAELEAVSTEGEAVFNWNGESSSGLEVSTGIYTARLCSGNTIITATLLKLE